MNRHSPSLFEAALAHVVTEHTNTCICPECQSVEAQAFKRRRGESEWETAGRGRPRGIGPYPRVNTPLPRSGPGFISSAPTSSQFGLPETIQALQSIGAAWQRAHPNGPVMNIRDISFQGGGPMPGHKSHRLGVDMDIRPMRNDGKQGPVVFCGCNTFSSMTPLSRMFNPGLITTIISMCVSFHQEELLLRLHHHLRLLDVQYCVAVRVVVPWVICRRGSTCG